MQQLTRQISFYFCLTIKTAQTNTLTLLTSFYSFFKQQQILNDFLYILKTIHFLKLQKLNQTDSLAFEKYIIWDSYKQRLIISSNRTVYLISTRKNLIELYQEDNFITQLRLFPERNIIQYSTYFQNVLLDYDYLLNDGQNKFPNLVNPRFFKVNDNVFFQLNDINTQANLFVNQAITSAWMRNNLNSGYIRIVDNDLQKYLVYIIFDNELNILDLRTSIIVQIDQVFLPQNIIKILFENKDQVILLSQSQQVLQLKKKQTSIQINEVTILKQGLAEYLFINNLSKLIFTDFSGKYQINIIDLSLDQNGVIKGTTSTQIQMPSRILSIQQLSSSQIVILMNNLIKIYDFVKYSEIASVGLDYNVDFGNILVDSIYKRIFLQNQLQGSFVYDYSLQAKPSSFIGSFSANVYFDDNFIYSVVSHSANIYFRSDLKLLFSFRHFGTILELKNIRYLGVGYFFLVEFITKFSIYEFSLFVSLPTEKSFVLINQFSIIQFSFDRLIGDNSKSSKYQFNVKGFTQEGLFTYNLSLDVYNQQQTQSCSLNYQLQQNNYQNDNSFSQMSSYLSSQQRKLNGITINISKYQSIYIPQLDQNILNSIFSLIIAPKEKNTIAYVEQTFRQQYGISFIQIKNLEMQPSPQDYNNYLINNAIPPSLTINQTIFPNIRQILFENITISETSVKIYNIERVVIQKINLHHFENQTLPTLTQLSIANVSLAIITEINIQSCKFNLGNPLIILENIQKIQISSITISNCACSGQNSFLLVQNVQNFTLDNILISGTYFSQESSFILSSVKYVKIEQILLTQLQFVNNQQSKQRLLQSKQNKQTIQKIFDFTNNIDLNFGSITIFEFYIDTSNEFTIFNFELVYGDLSVQQVSVKDVRIKNDQKGTIFLHSGVYDTNFQQNLIEGLNNMRYLQLQYYKISDAQLFQCKNLKITNLTTINTQLTSQSFIQIASVDVLLDNIQITKITYSQSVVLQQVQLISLVASNSLVIQNSSFNQISNSPSSTILIRNSQNVNIQNTSFQSLTTSGSSPAFTILDSQNLIIKSIVINQCSSNKDSGAIYIENCDNISFLNNRFKQNLSKNGNGGVVYLLNSQINNFDYNQFISNSVVLGSGGAIYCENTNISSLNSNTFTKNLAIQGSGGALLLKKSDILQIQDNEFTRNQAFIGGAIRYTILKPLALMEGGVSFLKKSNQFYKNTAISYGMNVGSYPKILDMKNYYIDNSNDSQGVLNDVQSGYKSKTPILMRFIDEEMREVAFVNLSLYPQVSKDIIQEMSLYILQAESSAIGLLGDLRQVYSFSRFAFVFDLSYSYLPQQSSILNIKSAQLLPQFLNNSQEAVQVQFNVPITINFRKCQIGEVLQLSGNYTLCQTCDQGTYSIVEPYSETQINCKRCPIGSVTCQGSQIQVQNGYWKEGNQSDVIVECQQSEVCQPEDPQSKNGCIRGFVGPTCSECDVSGNIWGTQFSRSNQDCRDCSRFLSPVNIILQISVLIFIFLQIYSKIHNEIVLIRKYIAAKYLSKLKFISPNIQRTQTSQASLIKILLNYCQFLMIVNSLNIKLPTYFTFFNLAGGDTSELTIYSIDCLLFKQQLSLPNYVVRLLWINFQPFALFVLLELFSLITAKKNVTHSQRQELYTNLIIIFIFFQPSVVKVISQSLSCQQIGTQNYITSDLSYKCLDSQHISYILKYILPMGVIWIFAIPVFLLIRMKTYKSKMQTIKILFRYGYLYQEYEDDKYYWDLARILIRSTGIIVINIFNFQVLFKGMILFGVIFFYLILQRQLKPFILQKFNKLEQNSSFLVILTIYLLFIGNLSSNHIISYIVTIIIGVLNSAFVLKMIQLILIKPIPVEKKDRNKLQQILYNLKLRLPIFFLWVKMGNRNSSRPFKNWKKVSKIYQTLKQQFNSEENSFKTRRKLSISFYGISLALSKLYKNQEHSQKQKQRQFKLLLTSN